METQGEMPVTDHARQTVSDGSVSFRSGEKQRTAHSPIVKPYIWIPASANATDAAVVALTMKVGQIRDQRNERKERSLTLKRRRPSRHSRGSSQTDQSDSWASSRA